MKVMVFGASGSAGGSVLRACLAASSTTEVRAIVRRPFVLSGEAADDRSARKLQTILHTDFENYAAVRDAFVDLEACMFCLGKSVTQVADEAEYRRLTHDFALAAAAALRAGSPAAVFHFVSGAGASLDSDTMWARVKAETERDLIATGSAVCWRPAAIDGVPSASQPPLYRALRPLLRLMKPSRRLYVNGEDLGLAMLLATAEHLRGRIIENTEIRDLADQARALEQLAALRHADG